jgi:hypothetical protein
MFNKNGDILSNPSHLSIHPINILTSRGNAIQYTFSCLYGESPISFQPSFRGIFMQTYTSTTQVPSLKFSESFFTRIENNCPLTSLAPLPKNTVYPPASYSCPKKP